MAMFTIRLKELQVAFGTAFLPVVKNVAEAMTTFVDKVKESNIALATQGFCSVCGNVTYDGTCIVKGHP